MVMHESQPTAVFWDNDGVLVDTERWYFQASREALANAGITLSDNDFAELSLRRGESVFLLAERVGMSTARIEALREFRNRRYAELLQAAPELLLPGAAAAVARVRRQVAIMGIVSNSLPEHFALIHARTGLLDSFDFHLVHGDYPQAKPHPAPYLAALALARVAPQAAIAVEDSERGMRSALAAGLRCLVVPHELSRRHDFSGATAVCRDLVEVAERLTATATYCRNSHS